jgi:hypothetical protein
MCHLGRPLWQLLALVTQEAHSLGRVGGVQHHIPSFPSHSIPKDSGLMGW